MAQHMHITRLTLLAMGLNGLKEYQQMNLILQWSHAHQIFYSLSGLIIDSPANLCLRAGLCGWTSVQAICPLYQEFAMAISLVLPGHLCSHVVLEPFAVQISAVPKPVSFK